MRSNLLHHLGVAAAFWAVSGCASESAAPITPKALAATGGNAQIGCVQSPLPESLEVTLTGSSDKPLAGAAVTWAVLSGSAMLSQTVRPTDAAGRSRVQLQLGLALSPVAVSAAVAGLPPVTFSATAKTTAYGLGQT